MSEHELHPDVKAFQAFINQNPTVLREIRKSGEPIQWYYDRWEKNKENDPLWRGYLESDESKNSPKSEQDHNLMDHIVSIAQYIDLNKIEKCVNQFQQALQTAKFLLNDNNEKKDDHNKKDVFRIIRD